MKRIFIAHKVAPDLNFERIFASVKSELADDRIKWAVQNNIHITLLFIGDSTLEAVNKINSALKKSCTGKGSFELVIRGLGVFKTISDPRIIWAGLDKSTELTELKKVISESLCDAGIEFEDRPYNPHITLGRMKQINDKDKLRLLTERYQHTEIQRMKVNEVILYESILKPEGPSYKPLGIYKL